jgi:hypothetical protein
MRSGREVSEDDSESETELDEELLEVSSESESESLDNEESEEEDGSSSRLRFKVLVFELDTYGREAVDDCFNFLCVSFVSLNVYTSTWKIHRLDQASHLHPKLCVSQTIVNHPI